MDPRNIQLFEIKLEKDAGASKIHQLYLGSFPLGLDLIVKKQQSCLHVELGFGTEYASGTWIITKPFAMWTGNTNQEPYTMQLGYTRQGQECLNMGMVTNMKEVKRNVIDYMESPQGKAKIATMYAQKVQVQKAELQLSIGICDFLLQHMGVGQ